MNYPKFKIGFMPTRRRFFSKEDSLKYKAMIAGKILSGSQGKEES